MTSNNPVFLRLLRLVVFAMLGTVLFVQQVLLSWIPNVELVTVLLIVITRVYGARAFYPLAVFVALEALFYGLNTWVINYLYVWPVLVVAALLLRRMSSRVGWAVLAGFFGLIFGFLCALLYVVIGGVPAMVAYWVSGLRFDLVHCVGNTVTTLVLVEPLYQLFTRHLSF